MFALTVHKEEQVLSYQSICNSVAKSCTPCKFFFILYCSNVIIQVNVNKGKKKKKIETHLS